MVDWRGLWQSERVELTRFWGLEWSSERLVGALIDREEGHLWLTSPFSIDLTPEQNAEQGAAALIAALTQKMASAGLETPIVVVLPREAVVMRQLQLPTVPANELPDLVAFQAAAKSSTPTASLVIDFVPVDESPTGQTTVLAVTLDSPRIQRIRDLVSKTGRSLAGIEVSSFLLAEIVARAEEKAGTATVPTLVVAQSGDRVEIAVLDRNRLIAAHATWLPAGEASRHVSPLQMELNRCLVSLDQTHPGVEVSQVYLIEEQATDIAVGAALCERFGDKVHRLSLEGFCPDVPSAWRVASASFLGRGLAETGLVPRVNLAAPRRPPAQPDHTRRNAILAGSAVVLLLGGLWWNYQSQMSEMNTALEDASTESASIAKDLEDGKPDLAAAKSLDDWISSRQDPLMQLDALQQLFPGTSTVYLTGLKWTASSGSKIVVSAEARAREREDIVTLGQQLTDAGWSVKPMVPVVAKRDPDYPWQAKLEAEWAPPPPPEPTPGAIKPTTATRWPVTASPESWSVTRTGLPSSSNPPL
ncbi:MAG: hypothetical protein DWH91_08590 [Planctomycetota bacterium]|nr:MAG: hypothetical protein DWH91_08590 [Planctomycetota bacterium]